MHSHARLCASPASRSRKICAKMMKNLSKSLQNFWKSGTPRAEKLHALSQRALRMLQNVAESGPKPHCIKIRKSQAPGVGITQILRPNRAKDLRSFRKFSGRRTHKNCVKSPGVVSQTARPPCSSFRSRCAFLCRIMRESSVEITQNLRKNLAKILQNFWKFGTPRAEQLHALSQRALRMLHNVAESGPKPHCIRIRKSQAPSVGI